MDPAACRVIYIDDRFNTERWISRDGLATPATPQKTSPDIEFSKLPQDLQANVNAFLTVFNQGMLRFTQSNAQFTDCSQCLYVVQDARFPPSSLSCTIK
jgi:hypothetical protein